MSRTKSAGLIKRAVRGTSDAGRAGWRPKVDMVESARINGLRPAAAPPIEPGGPRETAALVRTLEDFGAAPVPPTAAEAREIHEDRERTARIDPQPPRRMTQPGLFDGIGVKV